MCGIAGILYKKQAQNSSDAGDALLTLASCLQHRGSDSAGFALFGDPRTHANIQVMLPFPAGLPEPQSVYAAGEGMLAELMPSSFGFNAIIKRETICPIELAELSKRIESAIPGSTVSASGFRLNIFKTVGTASNLAETVGGMSGSHGIAHLRLATESRIDPAHAQPFWARGFHDIAVTHNGHITNYHKLRQQFEARGFSFASQNDSEIIGIYLGDKMSEGATFEQALRIASVELDGSFSFIAATKEGLGVTRDPFATKPLLYSETDTMLALASEHQALHHLMGDDVTVTEIQPRETRTWAIA